MVPTWWCGCGAGNIGSLISMNNTLCFQIAYLGYAGVLLRLKNIWQHCMGLRPQAGWLRVKNRLAPDVDIVWPLESAQWFPPPTLFHHSTGSLPPSSNFYSFLPARPLLYPTRTFLRPVPPLQIVFTACQRSDPFYHAEASDLSGPLLSEKCLLRVTIGHWK